jgi:hypothetical protein
MSRIPAARVDLIQSASNLITREWYRFLNDLMNTITSLAAGNVASELVQVAPVHREPTKSRREVLPFAVAVGASPFTYTNNSDTESDAIFDGGTITNVWFTRDGTNYYLIGAPRSLVRLSPYDSVLVVYTSAPTLTIIPR